MGTVYLASHEQGGGQVALKVLGDSLSSNPNYVARFYREAKSGALLSHPNIVRTITAGQDRATGKHYLVLEFVDGPSAHALLDRLGPLPIGDAVHIARDVARALEHAHSRNVVHRDIKPDNILLARSGVAKLVDLGLARRIDEVSHLTATRQGFGTTPYMPYEQAISAKQADGRSDIYALGATLYHLLTGEVPFPGSNHLEVMDRKKEGTFAPASTLRPGVPPALDQILARMLAPRPRDRYQTASELIVELERCRLATAVPTFADPEEARHDPWMQACLAVSAEPTRLDPASSHRLRPPTPADEWQLRFRNGAGRMCRARATTAQIVRSLRRGRLSPQAEARRSPRDAFCPLSSLPDFEGVRPNRPRRTAPSAEPAPSGHPRRGLLRWLRMLLGAGAALLAVALLVVCWCWLFS